MQSAGGDGFLMWMVLRALHLDGGGFSFLGTQIEGILEISKIYMENLKEIY
ncbi:hypothetical protein [Flavobacterium celericrescens]|uniref:Uncharacterized protein n=1 Tax=Flavobacterium celericrescens TaxID=2709780 RepID=A0ABX0ID36_9FLAO|nr:hypothetical protein [Flavobacterium celericrescens]NHM04100.1 hypothetical protein [Flavobacterium celericrescens]